MPPQKPPFGLVGALVSRVDKPFAGLFVLSLDRDRETHFLALDGARPGKHTAALVPARPRGEAADDATRGLREKIETARVLAADMVQGSPRLWLSRGDLLYELALSPRGLLATRLPSLPPEAAGDLDVDQIADLIARGDDFIAAHHRARLAQKRAEADRAVSRTLQRAERRLVAIAGDGQALSEADAAAARARLFVGLAHAAKPGTRELSTVDWASGGPVEIRFAVPPDRTPREAVEAVFATAKRLRKGVAIAERRRAEAAAAVALLEAARARLAHAASLEEVDQVRARLRATLPGDLRVERESASPTKGPQKHPVRMPYRSFVSTLGTPLLVGKGGADNDALTLGVARPHDVFLHAKDGKGAHVIAGRAEKKQPLDARVLLEGALLAAHFSSERSEGVVLVQWCERRHLRKRKGAAPGLVELTQERVLSVRLDEARIGALLGSENR